MTATVWRFRLAATCLLLATFAFLQSPGETAADTKLDLAVDPLGFLGRALTLWDPQGFFGQLQNQAYGYLFPMGPFFGLGDLVALPPWVVQRLWWALLMCAAFTGTARLIVLVLGPTVADERRSGRAVAAVQWGAIVGGLAYALAPRMVTTLGPVSAESLPMALTPWMLVPLVLADRGRDPRRMAALSGAAVLAMGAVNAVATLAALPLAAWWILTRSAGRLRLGLWWGLAVTLATAWWVVPLLLLGRFSPPFLDWIESAAVTTRPNDVGTVLRGTSHWVAYVVEPSGPVWPAGWSLVSSPALVLATGSVVLVALLGMARRDLPERAFVVGAAAVGLALVSFGHTGVIQGLGADGLQDLLDGVLAPLRNVHKTDVVLRTALAVGVGHTVASAIRTSTTSRSRPGWVAVGAAGLAVAVSAWPLWAGQVTERRTYDGLPGYWQETADWLGERSGRALVVPGSSFGLYIWGRAQDEPLQPLASSPWAVRDAVPLSSAGNIRLLDAVDAVLSTGRGSAGLAEVLSRSGVQWVVVRNDLSGQARPPRAVLLHQALDRSPGLAFRAGFGPVLPPFRSGQEVADDGLQQPYTPVEVWEVVPADGRPVSVRPASDAWTIVGGPEALVNLAEAELLQERVAVLEGEPTADRLSASTVVTDTYRRTELDVGQVRDNRSQTLTEDAPFELERAVHDYHPIDSTSPQPVAREPGYSVAASSAGSSVTALRARRPSAQPWSALDGDPATAWVSGDLRPGVGQWWEVRWDDPVDLQRLRVSLVVGDVAGAPPATVRVVTDRGEIVSRVRATDRSQSLSVVPGLTRSLRISLESVVDGGPGDAFGIAEVEVPGLEHPRPVEVPGEYDAQAIVLQARRGERYGCVHSVREVQCSRRLPQAGEERAGVDRLVTLSEPGRYHVTVRVQPRPGLALDRLLEPGEGRTVATASSRVVSDPAAGPAALLDGDRRTAWLADPLDVRPVVTVRLPEVRDVTGLRLDVPPELAASRPLQVTVGSGNEERRGFVDSTGAWSFAPLTGRVFDVAFGITSAVASRDPLTGAVAELPVGMAELRLDGAEDLMEVDRPDAAVGVPCGFGPDVVVDGVGLVDTSVRVPMGDVVGTEVVTATTCAGDPLVLSEGRHRITVASTEEFLVEQVELVRDTGGPPAQARALGQPTVRQWTATERVVDLAPSSQDRVLETTENANEGWRAVIGETVLEPLVVDGWRQAWIVPAGTQGTVRLTFAPQRWYQAGLAAGAVLVVALAAMWAVPTRSRREKHPDVLQPVAPARSSRYGWTALPVVAACVSVAAVPGLAAAATVAWVLDRRPTWRPQVVVASWGVSVLVAVVWTWPESLSQPGLVAAAGPVAALVGFVAAALPDRPVMAGSSTVQRPLLFGRWQGRSPDDTGRSTDGRRI